jgi:PAS domain-containing protein
MKSTNSGQPLPADNKSFIRKPDADQTTALYDELQDLPDSVIQTDLNFLITGWNDSAEKMYGLP